MGDNQCLFGLRHYPKMMIKKGKKIIFHLVILSLLCFSLPGCIEDVMPEKIGVIVSILPQVELLNGVGGEYVEVTVMVPAGESPHTFEPTPNQMRKVARARAYFMVGSGIEFENIHMETILEQNPGLVIFDCSRDIRVVSYDEHFGYLHDEHQYGEEENGDNFGHNGTDPHVWTSPINLKKMAQVVLDGLIEIDIDNKSFYQINYETYINKIDNVHTTVDAMLKPYINRSFMVYHPAWGYFGDVYHLKQIPIQKEGKEPNPSGIAAIIHQAKKENITIIFVSPQFDISNAEIIADEIGGHVAYVNPLMMDFESTILKLASDIVLCFQKYKNQNY